MQYVYLPGWPCVERSSTPGWAPRQFSVMSRIARPRVALARRPGPNTLPPALKSSRCRIGPLTTTSVAEPPVLVMAPCSVNAGSAIARNAASSTGMYSGRQPASTALIATFSAVIERRRVASTSTTSSGACPAAARNRRTAGAVAGTTGSPSVQPRSKQVSIASGQSATSCSAAASAMGTSLPARILRSPSPCPSRAMRVACGRMVGLDVVLQALLSGLFMGSVYALIAIGFTLVFGVTDVVNFAHGHFVMGAMFAAYLGYRTWGIDPYLSIVAVLPLFFALGVGIYHLVIRRIVDHPHSAHMM